MKVYMALAPPWAQIRPPPPPAAKFPMNVIRYDQRTLEVSGQLGHGYQHSDASKNPARETGRGIRKEEHTWQRQLPVTA